MLEQAFQDVYTKFKLHFYRAVFGRFKRREATLTTVETFCMEIIMALGRPTINEFARFYIPWAALHACKAGKAFPERF